MPKFKSGGSFASMFAAKRATAEGKSPAPKFASPAKATTEVKSEQKDAPAIEHGDKGTYSGTLSAYYAGQGKDLPSVEKRKGLYKEVTQKKDEYKGTAEQNKALYKGLTTKTTATTKKSSDIGKGKEGDIKKVVETGFTPEGAYAKKTNIKKGAGVTDVADIKEGDVKKEKDLKKGRAGRKAQRLLKRAKKQEEKAPAVKQTTKEEFGEALGFPPQKKPITPPSKYKAPAVKQTDKPTHSRYLEIVKKRQTKKAAEGGRDVASWRTAQEKSRAAEAKLERKEYEPYSWETNAGPKYKKKK